MRLGKFEFRRDPCLSVCVCVSLASDSSHTIEIIIIQLGTLTTSEMVMHHMLVILTLTFIQGQTDLNHKNNKSLIISVTMQAMPIMFAVKILRLKSIWPLPVRWPWLSFKVTSASQAWLNIFNYHYLEQYLSYYILTWHDGRLIHGIYAHSRVDDTDLDARS